MQKLQFEQVVEIAEQCEMGLYPGTLLEQEVKMMLPLCHCAIVHCWLVTPKAEMNNDLTEEIGSVEDDFEIVVLLSVLWSVTQHHRNVVRILW